MLALYKADLGSGRLVLGLYLMWIVLHALAYQRRTHRAKYISELIYFNDQTIIDGIALLSCYFSDHSEE